MDFHQNLIVEFSQEVATTRKLIEAIPEDADWEYKPSDKSMSFSRLVGHIVEMHGSWAKITLTQNSFDMGPYTPWIPVSKAELLERLESGEGEVKKALADLPPADWGKNWKLTGGGQTYFEMSKYMTWRIMVLNHIIHHRGQMSVYLRHFGARLPGLYGPSADGM